MTKFDHFSFLAPYYEKVIKPNLNETLREMLDLQPGQWVLDAAGGTGRLAQFLAGDDRHVIVGDYSYKMVVESKKKIQVMVLQMAVEQLPFPKRTFDRVLIVDALHHVFDQYAAINSLVEVLKPGGRLVIEEPDIGSGWVKVIAFLEKLLGMRSKFFSAEEISQIFVHQNGALKIKRQALSAWVLFQKFD